MTASGSATVAREPQCPRCYALMIVEAAETGVRVLRCTACDVTAVSLLDLGFTHHAVWTSARFQRGKNPRADCPKCFASLSALCFSSSPNGIVEFEVCEKCDVGVFDSGEIEQLLATLAPTERADS